MYYIYYISIMLHSIHLNWVGRHRRQLKTMKNHPPCNDKETVNTLTSKSLVWNSDERPSLALALACTDFIRFEMYVFSYACPSIVSYPHFSIIHYEYILLIMVPCTRYAHIMYIFLCTRIYIDTVSICQ